MARHPAPTSSRAIGAPIQPTEPHAPLPNTGGEGAPPPARTMPPPSSQAATSTPPAAATPLQRPPAQATAQPSTQRYYVGVQRDKGTGKWAACVVDPSNPTKHRLVGAFPDEHAAALAHDRLDLAFRGGGHRGAGANFRPAFHAVELEFLRLCAATSSPGSHCGLVAGGDKYDEKYSEFLRKIYHGVMDNSPSYKKFFDVILDFFIARAREIGREALEDGGDMLVERFVAMHKNKAVTPRWRAWYRRKVEEAHAKQVDAQQRLRQQAMEEAQAKQVAAQQEAMANKRKVAEAQDDREHKRQELDPPQTQYFHAHEVENKIVMHTSQQLDSRSLVDCGIGHCKRLSGSCEQAQIRIDGFDSDRKMGFCWMDSDSCKRRKHEGGHDSSSRVQSQSSILSRNRILCHQLLEQCDDLKYGSSTNDYKAISMKRLELISILQKLQEVPIQLPYASPLKSSETNRLVQDGRNSSCRNIIDLDSDNDEDYTFANVDNIGANTTVVLVDSDDGDSVASFVDEKSSDSKQNANYIEESVLPEQHAQQQEISMLDNENISSEAQAVKKGKDSMDINDVIYNKSGHEEIGEEEAQAENVQIKGNLKKEIISVASDELACEVMRSQSPTNGNFDQYDNSSTVDELEGLWMDMSLAMACSKTVGSDHNIVPSENSCEQAEDECQHDFLMKDDLGIVCRVCGLIQQRIENIFEYQWKKRKQSYRARPSEHRNSSDADAIDKTSGAILEVVPDALCLHPQHSQHMKPHQVEGFNFLVKNLADENNPGGCILAHAPGSGKTFLIISFVHSFLAKYPAGRPLIILPKGILSTWRTEFLHWQVDDIPLYDFYSSKADKRSEQLKVLNLWEESRSILLLGYQQFACIVSDHTSDTEAIMCQEKLLKVPSLVILDEGHTPRNEETDLLTSLENIRTPRKVVLSGTLFQNHVREVFNILKLVRSKFLKMDKSRAIVNCILSKVDLMGKSARSKNISDKDFFDLVQEHLQKDGNDKMRAVIIQNLRELTADVLHYYQGKLLDELPGIVDFTVFLNMSSKQEHIIKGLDGINKFAKRSRCNAVSLHPCLKNANKADADDGNVTNRKIGSIISGIDINDGVKAKFVHNLLSLSEATGEKVLVFSQYVRSLIFLEKLVSRMKGWKSEVHIFRVTGGSTQDQREQAVHRFNNSPDARVFFGSIKACGEGISLVGASRIVILDVHENPSVMRQAIGRAYRPGQSKMVYCYRLVAADSPEEDDHHTAFKKERVSKLWFEWNELCSSDDFELATVDVSDSEDRFLESPALKQDIKALLKR
uniref:Uncharacterized protein n=1 Tax=Oryza rufipogon TaxID=4529 RepID=A0A0E0NQ45_ORYRU